MKGRFRGSDNQVAATGSESVTIRIAKACLLAVLIFVLPVGAVQSAEDMRKPAGRVILTVSGSISAANAGDSADFDLEMIHALGQRKLITSTPWTDGTQEFGGVLVRDLLKAVGATGTVVEAVALNDYAMEIDISDFENYPVILATTMNGEKLRVRDKGPLWIIYPRDDFEELREQRIDNKMVWQLRRLIIK